MSERMLAEGCAASVLRLSGRLPARPYCHRAVAGWLTSMSVLAIALGLVALAVR